MPHHKHRLATYALPAITLLMLASLLPACASERPPVKSSELASIASELDRFQESLLDAGTKESQVREVQKLVDYLQAQKSSHRSTKYGPQFAWSFQIRDLVTGQNLTSGDWNDGRSVDVTIVVGTNTTGRFRQLRALRFTLITGEGSAIDLLYKE